MSAVATPVRTEIALSLLGLDAWRLYRQGLQAGVIWDLYVGDRDFTTLPHQAHEVLSVVLGGDIYPDAAHLAAFIMHEVEQLNEGKQISFDATSYVMPPKLPVVLNIDADDPDAIVISHLMTFMVRAARGSKIADEFLSDLARIWFNIYDAALLTEPAEMGA